MIAAALRGAALAAMLGSGAMAFAPADSPRPVPRPHGAVVADAVQETAPAATTPVLRPLAKPRGGAVRLAAAAVAAKPGKPGRKGAVCGVPGIVGVPVAAIPGKAKGCGLQDGVNITSIAGVPLSQPATIDCTTARALHDWVEKGIRPAIGKTGGGLAGLEIAASYNCRPRNNQKGAKISEHGRGRAVDLSGVRLANGEVISVLKGWSARPKIVKAIHRSACGTFGTVLGPNSDRFHKDHIHVDTARYRSGSYCR